MIKQTATSLQLERGEKLLDSLKEWLKSQNLLIVGISFKTSDAFLNKEESRQEFNFSVTCLAGEVSEKR